MTIRSRVRSALRRLGYALLMMVWLFSIGRAVVEFAVVDPSRPEAYGQDWGGPHYLGVMLVHAGPGILALVVIVLYLQRRSHRSAGATVASAQ